MYLLFLLVNLWQFARSLAPRSLPDLSPISPRSDKGVPLNFFLSSESANLKPPSNIFFLSHFPSSVNESNCRRSIRLTLAAPNHQKFCLLYGVQREFLVHIPPQKVKTVQITTFIWVYFPQMTLQILIMKILPNCFNQVNKIWRRKETNLLIIYILSNTLAVALGKYESRFSSTSSTTSSITLFFACIDLRRRGNITIPRTTEMLCLGFWEMSQIHPPPVDDTKIKTSWSACDGIGSEIHHCRQKAAVMDFADYSITSGSGCFKFGIINRRGVNLRHFP